MIVISVTGLALGVWRPSYYVIQLDPQCRTLEAFTNKPLEIWRTCSAADEYLATQYFSDFSPNIERKEQGKDYSLAQEKFFESLLATGILVGLIYGVFWTMRGL